MSYVTLKERLQAWIVDSDTDFTEELDNIIALGEVRLARDLNVDAMRVLVTGSLSIGDPSLAKDSVIIGVRWFSITVGTRKVMLDLRQDSYIRWKYMDPMAANGQPIDYGFSDASTFVLGPPPDEAYPFEIMTEQRVVGLDAETETWLSTRFDDLLFYSCLMASGSLEKDSDEETRYTGLYAAGLAAAKAEVARGRMDSLSLTGAAS